MITYRNTDNLIKSDIENAISVSLKKNPEWGTLFSEISVTPDGTAINAPGYLHWIVEKVYERASEIKEERLGMKTFYVSYKIDARVDVPIKAKSLKEAKDIAQYGHSEFDWNDVELIDTEPVNISDSDGELLEDF